MRRPHPVPYQGSKRLLADRILAVAGGRRFETLHEPFAGSAALTIAAAARGIARRYALADSLEPLAALWQRILTEPAALAADYGRLWHGGLEDPATHYLGVRDRFNAAPGSAELLYLLARCVKAAPRFNAAGAFNQSADRRRLGVRPERMRGEIEGAATLLSGRTTVRAGDFRDVLARATIGDLVYLDPPWQGTSRGPDRRYRDGLDSSELVDVLVDLDARGVPWLLSYDGRHGERTYGEPLPAERVGATRLELVAGRSAQATLSGRSVTTVESLYVSRHLGVTARAVAA